MILTIFCLGATINSVSANEDYINLTSTDNNVDLSQNSGENIVDINNQDKNDETIGIDDKNQDELESTVVYHIISMQTANCVDSTNPNKLKVLVGGYDSNGQCIESVKSTTVTYEISDYNSGKMLYSTTAKTDSKGYCTFDSNYDIFKNLGKDYYKCYAKTDLTRKPLYWEVGVPKGQLNIQILTSQYTNCKNTYSLETKVLFESNRAILTPKITYIIKNSKNVEVYRVSNTAENAVCTFDSNYNIFNTLPEGTYSCELSVNNCAVTGIGYYSGNTFKWNILVDNSITFTPSQPSPSTPSSYAPIHNTKHYAKYVKVGKYKIKVWSDDSLNTQKYKVRKYLKSHVKKAHTFKIHGYKFKVSAKMYRKILYYNKYGYDGKMGYANFKAKTRYKMYKEPIYKEYKVTKKVWVYKKVLSGWARWGDDWYDDEYYSLSKYFKNGWESYGYSDREYSNGADHYVKLKKKVKKTIIKEKFVGYKKVKLRVYSYGMLSHNKVAVQFWGLKNGQKYAPLTNYCKLK